MGYCCGGGTIPRKGTASTVTFPLAQSIKASCLATGSPNSVGIKGMENCMAIAKRSLKSSSRRSNCSWTMPMIAGT